MVGDFWSLIFSYTVGIIVTLALLVALVESSRKYDKFRQSHYLITAIGYFVLMVWALLNATIIGLKPFYIVSATTQIIGLVLITIGYLTEHHLPPLEEESENKETKIKAESVLPSWATHLAAKPTDETPDDEATDTPKTRSMDSLKSSAQLSKQLKQDKPAKTSVEKSISEAFSDLSNLRKKSAKKHKVTQPEQINREVASESREEIMEDLFPVETKKLKNSAQKFKKSGAPALLFILRPLNLQTMSEQWPTIILAALAISLIIVISQQKKRPGKNWLTIGFLLLGLSYLISLFSTGGLSTAIQIIGFILIGIGKWLAIKGRLTHHFLSIISLIYAFVLGLIIAIATILGQDTVSLQLLFLLGSTTLVLLLPIIHSFAYSQPDNWSELDTSSDIISSDSGKSHDAI